MKEGTGKPLDPDIAINANVKMRELYFEEVPDPEVRFQGKTRRNSVWGSRRKGLPNEVQEGVVYRNAEVRLLIASEITDSDPGFGNTSGPERVSTNLQGSGKGKGESESTVSRTYLEQEPEEQEIESREGRE